jgi:probable F420-dependent oxidoreductase
VHIGVVYPQAEIATDVGAVRAFAAGVEDLGYDHILAYDHVVGADPTVHTDWRRPYDIDTTFHEPLVLYGFLAGIASLELVTGVIISPQRQTVLLAKQAAEVDILTGGRFRLGLGIGWNTVEYEALGQDFKTRGRRQEEQVELLRRLWTERSVTYEGRFDRVTAAGIRPLPVQRPIPIWLGGSSVPAYQRAGRLADGWFPQMGPGPELDDAIAVVQKAATEAGRGPTALGMEGRLGFGGRETDALVRTAQQWQDAQATHFAVNTLGQGLSGVDAHLDALAVAADALRVRETSS